MDDGRLLRSRSFRLGGLVARTLLAAALAALLTGALVPAGSARVSSHPGSIVPPGEKIRAPDDDTVKFAEDVDLSADGDTLVAGSPLQDLATGQDAGAAYVFERGVVGFSDQQITAADGAAEDEFGQSVAVSGNGNTVVVGAGCDSSPWGDCAGAAYVFERGAGGFSQTAKLTPDEAVAEDRFGQAVAISRGGGVIVVGARRRDPGGAVFVFERGPGGYTQGAELVASDRSVGDALGQSVDVDDSGRVVVAGAHGAGRHGAAYLFVEEGRGYAETKLLHPSPDPGTGPLDGWDLFGWSVALSPQGDEVLVGAIGQDEPWALSRVQHLEEQGNPPPNHLDEDHGAAYLLRREGSGFSATELLALDRESYDHLGWGVALSSDAEEALVSTPFDGGELIDLPEVDDDRREGSMYLFHPSE